MLEAMLVVTAIAMVVLVLTIRRYQNVEHGMWVKMVNMEFEIDRLRGLLGPSTVQIGCSVGFEPQHYLKGGKEYVDHLVNMACDSFGRCISKELVCYIRPLVIEGIQRSKNICVGEMQFRMPMIRNDFESMTCYIADKFWPGRMVPIVSEDDHRRERLKEHMEVEHFKDVLDSLHVDTKTILQNLEQ